MGVGGAGGGAANHLPQPRTPNPEPRPPAPDPAFASEKRAPPACEDAALPSAPEAAASILLRPCILITAALIFMSRDSRGTAGCHFPRPRTPPTPHPSSRAESWVLFLPSPSPFLTNSWCTADLGGKGGQ